MFFTTESKSIILMPGFSTTKLHPRSSQTTNIDDLILGLLLSGCPGKLVERFGEEVKVDYDGEELPEGFPVDISIIPQAINIVVPK